MRLCFIGDSSSIHTQRWVRWFAEDHEVMVISTGGDSGLADLSVCDLPTGRSGIGLRLLSSVRAVRAVVRKYRPDVLHGHFINEAGWFAAAAGWRPFVVTAWGSDLYRAPTESRLARQLNPRTLRAADWVTCDSEHQAALVRSWGVERNRVSVIGWGVDRREFHPGIDGSPMRARLDIPAGANVVLSPRRWIPNSNIEAIVAAHAILETDAYLVLKRVPRSEREDYTRSLDDAIAASPARSRIIVLGEIEPEELAALYGSADVVVSLCSTDGTPVSILEAMALGKPVVALQNESLAEWVSEPGGRLIPDLDPDGISKAISALLSPATRDRAAAHNLAIVSSRADRHTEMEKMSAIYARLASQRRRDGSS